MLKCIFVLKLQKCHNIYHIYNPEGGIRISVGKYLKSVKCWLLVGTVSAIKIVGFHFIYNYIGTLYIVTFYNVKQIRCNSA